MSHPSDTDDRSLAFYVSEPMPCPYLPEQTERKLFTRLKGRPREDKSVNTQLVQAGFRRSDDILYRPACVACHACVPVRVIVREFAPNKTMRRLYKRNAHLSFSETRSLNFEEHYALFLSYQKARHGDSEMGQMNQEEFCTMLRGESIKPHIYELRSEEGELWGALLADAVSDGLSAIYSYYKPEIAAKSLGTQLILSLIRSAHKHRIPYIYLGYWIARASNMAYKRKFKPLQALGAQGWERLPPLGSASEK